jgi:enoyl-CoA hydratase/carnithine racemase
VFTTLRAEIVLLGERLVGRLTLDQPDKLNPLGSLVLAELAEAASWFDSTDASVVIVTGAGRAFSAGFDLREFASAGETVEASVRLPSNGRDRADLGRRMADAIQNMNAVTIAAIHGPCIGGGLVLATACDLRIAADDSVFRIPEVDLGIPLTWGAIPRLVRELPAAIVRDLVLTCRPFDAAEAQSVGFVSRVVPRDELDPVVDELASSLAAKVPAVLQATKRQVNEALEHMATTSGAWAEVDLLRAALPARRTP